MAKVINQSIPSEYEKLYGEIARPASEMVPGSGVYHSQRRFPFRLPARAGKGNIDGTPNQHEVRQIFKECANCYNIQPYSDGVAPPAVGPRNRSWWHSQAVGSGLWYYDYFMQQTLNSRFADTVPDWCQIADTGDAHVYQGFPNNNYGHVWEMKIRGLPGFITSPYFKWNTNQIKDHHIYYLNLYFYVASCDYDVKSFTYQLDLRKVLEPWGEYTLTYNNQPALGAIVSTTNITIISPEDGGWVEYPYQYYRFPLGEASKLPHGVCLSMQSTSLNCFLAGPFREEPTFHKPPYISG